MIAFHYVIVASAAKKIAPRPTVRYFITEHTALLYLHARLFSIDTSRICLSAHKTIEAGNENRLFTMDYIARLLDFKLLFCVHSSKFGKCLFP